MIIRALLKDSGLPNKFWPYAFHHSVRLLNALSGQDQTESPISIVTGHQDDLTGLKTFGCRVWVKPPTRRRAKFKSNARKGIFLGYMPHTLRNFLWYDVLTDRVKLATHARFDEGFNDLPVDALPPNVQYILRSEGGERSQLPIDSSTLNVQQLRFETYPFSTTFVGTIPHPCDHQHCGLQLADDSLLHRSYVTSVAPSSSASKIHKDLKATLKKIRGAYITKINETSVFSSAQVKQALLECQKKGGNISITFALEPKQTAKQLRQAYSDFNLFLPAASKGIKPSFANPPGANGDDQDDD